MSRAFPRTPVAPIRVWTFPEVLIGEKGAVCGFPGRCHMHHSQVPPGVLSSAP